MIFGNVSFEAAILRKSKKNNFLFHKRFITFVCNSHFEKESLKIKKVNSKNGNFI